MRPALFDIQDREAHISQHCYTIGYLKDIIDEYGEENATKIFTYFHYMWSLSPEDNPFAEVNEFEKQEKIVRLICPEIDIDDPLIQHGLELVGELYTSPTYEVYKSFKILLDKLAVTIRYANISVDKEDGNIGNIKALNTTYQEIKTAYKDSYKDYQDELGIVSSRGGAQRSYDAGKQEELE